MSLAAAAQSPVPENVVVERVASGFRFVEGPVWHDGGLLFSDIPANVVYRWAPEEGVTVFRTPSQQSNGLAFDARGRFVMAQNGARRVARIEPDGTETVLASHYGDKRLNSPNDLALHPDGSLYFPAPTWKSPPDPDMPGFTGVYRLDPGGTLHLLVDSLDKPNGITFSPDFGTLYVSNSEALGVFAFDVDGHVLRNGRLFAQVPGEGATDGMKTDAEGRLYVTGPGGIWIYAPDGALIDRVHVPEQVTNCAWGDADGRTLYVTSGTALYRVRLDP